MILDPRNTRLVEVYEYYDRPVIHLAKDSLGLLFFVVHVNETYDYDIWLYAFISQQRLADVKANKIDLKSVFSEAEEGFVHKVKICKHTTDVVVTPVACVDLTDDYLPIAGEFLDIQCNGNTTIIEDQRDEK